jgi:hypothetical protein
MPRNQSTAARRARATIRDTDGKYTAALRAETVTPAKAISVRSPDVACAALAQALRRADLTEDAERLKALVEYPIPEDGFDHEHAHRYEETVIECVVLALATVATRPDVRFLAAAAATVLEDRALGFTADVVRGMDVLDVPGNRATPAAWEARRALWALVAASRVPHGGDAQWHTCMHLLDRAWDRAYLAARVPDRHRHPARIQTVPPARWRALLVERHPDRPELHHPPLDTVATRCTGCGQLRAIGPDSNPDPWRGHEDEH